MLDHQEALHQSKQVCTLFQYRVLLSLIELVFLLTSMDYIYLKNGLFTIGLYTTTRLKSTNLSLSSFSTWLPVPRRSPTVLVLYIQGLLNPGDQQWRQ